MKLMIVQQQDIVQPVLDQCGLVAVAARVEVMQALLAVAREKLESMLPQVVGKPALLRHLVDEVPRLFLPARLIMKARLVCAADAGV